jgi:hypothetical protein
MIPEPEDTVISADAYLLFFYKSSVDEFRRQTLTSDQLTNLEGLSPIKNKPTPKIVFQKSIRNTLTIKTKEQKQSQVLSNEK